MSGLRSSPPAAGSNPMLSKAPKLRTLTVALTFIALSGSAALAQKRYDPGATDTEIKIGNIMPYSGPAAAYGIIGKTEAAYFRMVNERGGINGRKINFISYDDAYSPPKAVEQARKLVESDKVLLVFNPLGTPSNIAIQKYLNGKKVPQLFVASGATRWGQPTEFPWTMGWGPSYQTEARVYARYILQNKPDAKIGVLYQNDDFGKDYLQGLKDGLGTRASSMIVATEAYDVTEQTVDARVAKLQQAGVDVFVSVTTPKFATQSIRKAAAIDWYPVYLQCSVSVAVQSVLKPAGLQNAKGILSTTYWKGPTHPAWKNDAGVARYTAFMAKYLPDADLGDGSVWYAYAVAQTLVQVLKQAGDTLTRENVMRQAASLHDFVPDTFTPGIRIDTAANDFYPIEQLKMMRFDGENWQAFGDAIGGELGGRSTPSTSSPVETTNPSPVDSKPASEPAIVQAQPPRPPVQQAEQPARPPVAPVQPPADYGRRVALVIGNSAYKNAPALPNPKRDAMIVAETLRKVGFQSVTLQTDLGRDAMVNAIRDFARLAQTADWAVVYFAGHGMEVGGTNYLLPVDAVIDSDLDVQLAAVTLGQILNATQRATKLSVVILDACRNNPYANQMQRTAASRGTASRGLARIEPDVGTLVLYAARDGETASDGDGDNSPFANALVKELQAPGVDVRRVFDLVRDDVQDMTKRQQMPYTYGSVSGRQNFYFVR
jgi:branched-chain amino acid transport system substrate-binding protein